MLLAPPAATQAAPAARAGWVRRHALLSYYLLTFAISWGAFVLAAGPDGFTNTQWQTDARFPLVVLGMLAGPTVAGLLLTGVLDGRGGLLRIWSSLLVWRVGAGWYLYALVPAPVVAVLALWLLGLSSPVFAAADKAAVVVPALVAGLSAIFEEVGWTGFAVPRFRGRHGVFATGLIVGVLWAAWHLLQQLYIVGTYLGDLPLGVYLPLALVSTVLGLTAYRVLMVRLYDRTRSLLVTTLMHSSLIVATIFLFTPLASGSTFLTYEYLFNALMWALVGIVWLGSRGSRRSDSN
jgi:CAAX protease family protein